MSGPEDTITYFMPVEAFDVSILPSDARIPGTDAFREAVSNVIAQDFIDFQGHVRIVVDSRLITVYCRKQADQPSLTELATRKLEKGDYAEAVRLMRMLLSQDPNNVSVLHNLGMALSNLGALDEAQRHLQHVLEIQPSNADALVALSVVLIRKGQTEQAIEVLKKAIAIAPNNAYAHRNLGVSFMKLNKMDDGIIHLRRATELKPDDQQAWFGLAQALELKGDKSQADAALLRVIDIDAQSPLAEQARSQRRKYAEESFRESARTTPRMDAVMYLVGALERFNGMKTSEIQKIAFEIGKLGQTGLDVNNSDQKYRLRTLPGQFSGLHLVCLMYAAFKIL